MKNQLQSYLSILFFAFVLSAISCKKEHTPQNIILYDKPLSEIQSYIQGKWQLHYGKGGISANMIQYYDRNFWKVTSNRIEITNKEIVITDTTIKWTKELGTYTNGEPTYVMAFYDKNGYPITLVADRIINDTLVLHDNSSDAVFYHFTKF